MTDLEMTRLCAEAMQFTILRSNGITQQSSDYSIYIESNDRMGEYDNYDPLHDDGRTVVAGDEKIVTRRRRLAAPPGRGAAGRDCFSCAITGDRSAHWLNRDGVRNRSETDADLGVAFSRPSVVAIDRTS